MKRQGLTLLVLALALVPAMAVAQLNSATIKADVPFAFTVADQTIPAGTCLVRAAGSNSDALWIGNEADKVAAYALPLRTESLEPSERTVIVFHKYGDRYFLSSIERSGTSAGYKMRETKVEKELRAQISSKPEEIRLAAK